MEAHTTLWAVLTELGPSVRLVDGGIARLLNGNRLVDGCMSERESVWFGLDRSVRPFVRAGFLLGVGLGGFFDGIVLHQILQWHHMVSARTDPTVLADLRLNVLADGLFHAATYAFTVAGVALLWRAWRRTDASPSGRTLLGAVIVGWGAFNLVEGIVDHHLLAVHHVWPDGPGPVILWDAAFLAWGLVFLVGGYAIVRSDPFAAPAR